MASISRRLLRRLVLEWLAVLLLVVMVLRLLSGTVPVRLTNDYIYDRVLSSHERLADSDIVIAAIDEDSLTQLGRWPWRRSIHADFLRQLSKAQPRGVIFDLLFTEPAADDAALTAAMTGVPNLVTPLILMPTNERLGADAGFDVVRPVVHGAKLGHIAVGTDDDGVIRRLRLNYVQNGEQFDTMAAQVLGNTSRSGEYVIPFNVHKGGYMTVSYRSVLDGEVDAAFLRDKYVLVGVTAAGLGDQFITPADGMMAGIEIHANVLDGLKNNLVVVEINNHIWVFAPIVLLMLMFLWLRDRWHLFGFGVLLFCFVALDVYLLWFYYVWLPPALSLLGMLLAYLLWSWLRLAVLVHYAQDEWSAIRASEIGLLPLLRPVQSAFMPHEIELIMNYTHRLHDVVANSLQNLPSGLLVVDALGVVRLCNYEAQNILARVSVDAQYSLDLKNILRFLGASVSDSFDLDLMELDGLELNGVEGVFVLHVMPVRHNDQLDMWLINLLELTSERQAQNARSELVKFLSHDLRTPQVSILAVLDLHPTIDVTVRNQIAHHVQRTLDWAADLVHLTQAQNDALNLVELNFAALAQESVDEIYTLTQAKNINVSLDDGGYDNLWLSADKALLSRAVMNLLSNAVRYSDVGGNITLHFMLNDGEIALQVTDDGLGMDTEQLNALRVQSNMRVNHSVTDAAGSLGIGLNMVYAIMRRHHGRLDINSKLGQGSVFTLVLPRVI